MWLIELTRSSSQVFVTLAGRTGLTWTNDGQVEPQDDGTCGASEGQGLWVYTRAPVASPEYISEAFDALRELEVCTAKLPPVVQEGGTYEGLRIKTGVLPTASWSRNSACRNQPCPPCNVPGLPLGAQCQGGFAQPPTDASAPVACADTFNPPAFVGLSCENPI